MIAKGKMWIKNEVEKVYSDICKEDFLNIHHLYLEMRGHIL